MDIRKGFKFLGLSWNIVPVLVIAWIVVVTVSALSFVAAMATNKFGIAVSTFTIVLLAIMQAKQFFRWVDGH